MTNLALLILARQCRHLVSKYHIYLPDSGRMAVTFVNSSNVAYLANAISETVRTVN